MWKNYLKVAFRNIIRNKAHSTINVVGLSVGIAACLLLFIVIRYELTYDKFQNNYNKIYRIVTESKTPDGSDYNPGAPLPLIEAVKLDMPDMIAAPVTTANGSQFTVLGKDPNTTDVSKKFIEEQGVYFSVPELFKVFNTTFLSGSADVIAEPGKAIITRKTAEKFFGDWKTAVGQHIKIDNAIPLEIGAVIDDVSMHSDVPMAIVMSFETFKSYPQLYNYTKDWGAISSNNQFFILAPEKMTYLSLQQQVQAISKKYDVDRRAARDRVYHAQPFSTMHFDTRFGSLGDHITSISTIRTLTLIGIFILLMASINFINLSTAQAIKRSKEVGIRKVMGSNRMNLFWQMMGETVFIVCIAWVIGITLTYIFLPNIKHVSAITEKLSVFSADSLILIPLIAVAVIAFSGIYPALILSGYSPILALKNKISSASAGGLSIRRTLVIAQFAISQVLIIGTIVAVSQMSFVNKADLGFNKNALLVITGNADSAVLSRQNSLKQDMLKLSGVESVSYSSDVPSSENNWSTNFAFDHKDDEDFGLFMKFGDKDYFKTYGLQFVAGRGFTESDTIKEIVVNETLIAKLGLKNPADAIGKEIRMGRSAWYPIVGVVKDFKTNSLREETKPTMIAANKKFYSSTGVKMKSAQLSGKKDELIKLWDRANPEYANRSYFMDESIDNFYRQENQLALVYKIFAGIAIFISCLGLYGLVSFMAVQKTKEVGIRKVLGASAGNIVYLFSKEFTILIVVAFVIASPLAWLLMKDWLSNFAYQVKPGFGVYFIAIGASVLIAWLTVGYKAIKAALANPVKSLRTE
jgi:putative ABC transport system permease protein